MKAWRRRIAAVEVLARKPRRPEGEEARPDPAVVEQMNREIRWGMQRLGMPIPGGVDERGIVDLSDVASIDLAHLEHILHSYREENDDDPWLDGVEVMAWLGLPGLPVTVTNFSQFCEALTEQQLRAFRSRLAGGWSHSGPAKTPPDERDTEIQAALMRAGHLRQFPRLPSREIDLAQLSDAELAALDCGDPT